HSAAADHARLLGAIASLACDRTGALTARALRTLPRERFGFCRADAVVERDAARVMGRPGDDDPVVMHREIRVMILAIGHPGERVHKADGVIVIGEAEGLAQLAFGMLPTWQSGEVSRKIGRRQRRGARPAIE